MVGAAGVGLTTYIRGRVDRLVQRWRGEAGDLWDRLVDAQHWLAGARGQALELIGERLGRSPRTAGAASVAWPTWQAEPAKPAPEADKVAKPTRPSARPSARAAVASSARVSPAVVSHAKPEAKKAEAKKAEGDGRRQASSKPKVVARSAANGQANGRSKAKQGGSKQQPRSK